MTDEKYRCTECGSWYEDIPNQCEICHATADEFFVPADEYDRCYD